MSTESIDSNLNVPDRDDRTDALFRTMADQAPVLIWLSGIDKKGTFFNRSWLEYTGRSLEQELGDGWIQSIHPDDLLTGLNPCETAFKQKIPFQTQFRLRRHDGNYRWFVETGVPRFLPNGDFAGFVGCCVDITDRIETEAAEHHQDEEVRRVADSVPMLISYVDANLCYKFNNHTYEKWFNVSREQLRGRHMAEVLGDQAFQALQPHLERVLRGEHVEYEEWVNYSTRGLACIHCNYVPDFDQSGKVRGFYVAVVDMTNERIALDALERNEQRLRIALDAGNLGDWEWEIQSDKLHLSKRVLELFDITEDEELTFTRFLNVIHEDDRQRVSDAVFRAVEDKSDYNIEYRTIRRNGSIYWIAARGKAFYDSGNTPVRMVGVALDITQNRRATDAIAEHARKLREEREIVDTLYQLGRTVAAELDLDKIVQMVTDESTRLTSAQFGAFFYNQRNEQGEIYSLYTLSGIPREHFAGRDMPRVTEVFGPTFRGEGIVRSDDIRKDPRYGKMEPHFGLPAWHVPVVSYLAVPVISRSGEVLGGLFFAHPDAAVFTERHERIVTGIASHAAVALDNARLYKEAQNVSAKLRLRTQELETVVQELEAFSYSVSHDLRAPLRAVDAFSTIIETDFSEQLPDEAKRYLKLVRENSAKMNALITDLLAFSRLSRQAMHRQVVDLNALVKSVVDELAIVYPRENVDFIYSKLPTVRADSSLIRQVLSNLISNALKYSGKNEQTRIEVGSLTTPEGETAVFVRDNGIGFNMKYSDKLFKVFHRLHRAEEYDGTGVGLAIVHRIVTRHGGRVWAEAEPGKGATFYFTLGSESKNAGPLTPAPVLQK